MEEESGLWVEVVEVFKFIVEEECGGSDLSGVFSVDAAFFSE